MWSVRGLDFATILLVMIVGNPENLPSWPGLALPFLFTPVNLGDCGHGDGLGLKWLGESLEAHMQTCKILPMIMMFCSGTRN